VSTTLIVDADDVARRLRIPLPLGEDDRFVIESAIADAQADVESYLGRPIVVTEFTEIVPPECSGGFPLAQTPVVEVVSAEPELDPPSTGTWTGLYTVVYRAGLDAAGAPEMEPIRRYVRTHASYSPEVQALLRRVDVEATRTAKSLSVDGQSVTYEDVRPQGSTAPGSGMPGALPSLASLDRWRIAGRRVYRRQGDCDGREPWPYGPGGGYLGGW
jgi:hypothetical protein